jgi:hypothetical protein
MRSPIAMSLDQPLLVVSPLELPERRDQLGDGKQNGR